MLAPNLTILKFSLLNKKPCQMTGFFCTSGGNRTHTPERTGF